MIFDMLKRLRSVVYLPNDYVCKKVSCVGCVPTGLGEGLLTLHSSHDADEPWVPLPKASKAPITQRSQPCRKGVVGLLSHKPAARVSFLPSGKWVKE
jgi:hypothetical protein